MTENTKKDICLVTAYTPTGGWERLGMMTTDTKAKYCKKWNYGLKVHTSGFDESRPASWSKILFVKEALKEYEWVFWIDADAAITNENIPLESFLDTDKELIITKDFISLNFGIFFLRRGDFANWFLDEIWKKTEYLHHGVWEQAAVWELWDKGLLEKHTKVEHCRKFNSFYHTEDNICSIKSDWDKVQCPEQYHWALGDFVVHFPGRSLDKKINGLGEIRRMMNYREEDMKPKIDLNVGSNLCVVSAYNDAFMELGTFTSRIKIAYCLRHQFNFRAYTEGFDTSRHPSWSKLLFILNALKTHEWVFWIDADAVFTNHSTSVMSIISLGGDMFVCREHKNIINFGVFLIRRCDWSLWLLNKMWCSDKWGWDGAWEQSAFNELAYSNHISNQVVHFPMRAFNSVVPPHVPEDMVWQPGDFIAHRLGDHTVAERKTALVECLEKVGLKDYVW